jgi:hypothetical protein
MKVVDFLGVVVSRDVDRSVGPLEWPASPWPWIIELILILNRKWREWLMASAWPVSAAAL